MTSDNDNIGMSSWADIKAEPIDESYLETSYVWFADEYFRKLIIAPIVSREAQKKWFESLRSRVDYKIWGIKKSTLWIGAFGIKNIDPSTNSGEYWGYIGVPEYRGRGIGKWMLNSVETYAKQNNIINIYLRVWKENSNAIALYTRFGYRITESDGDILRMEKIAFHG